MGYVKIGLCLIVVLATIKESSQATGVRELRNKYRKYLSGHDHGGYATQGSATAAAAVGPEGVSSSAAAYGGYYGQQPTHLRPQPPVQQQPPQKFYQPQYYSPVGGGAAAAGAVPAYYRNQPADYRPAQTVRRQGPPAPFQQQPGYAYSGAARAQNVGRQNAASYYAPPAGAATSSAASAAAVGGGATAAAAAATSSGAAHQQHYAPNYNHHVVDQEEVHEGQHEPETISEYAATSGTYGDGKKGAFEQGSYKRSTESLEKHEDGREDGDHYYNAQSYGKAKDVNKYTAFDNDDEDITHTPNLFRKKKNKTNFVSSYNKAHRETGSGVVAHDKHSSSYNKNSKKLKENVDQRYSKVGEGFSETKDHSSHADIDDEDEEAMDTRGLGTFVGVDGVEHAQRQPPNMPAAAAAAAAAATSSIASH